MNSEDETSAYSPSNSRSPVSAESPPDHESSDDPDPRTPQLKRKASTSLCGHYTKRSRYGFLSSYLNLFNSHFDRDPTYESDLALPASQIGSSRWSTREKAAFFAGLDRHGIIAVDKIAFAVRTKSVVEVQAYLEILQRGLKDLEDFGEEGRAADATDLEAAVEVGIELEESLEDAADGLAQRQGAWEDGVEKDRHGELWTIHEDLDLKSSLEEHLNEMDDDVSGNANVKNLLAAENLLKARTMNELSRLVFMNSRDPEYNYTTFAEKDRLPGMYLTAFLDFYNIVVTLTRRLVATSRFMALSRIRALEPQSGRGIYHYIKRGDVKAALDSLKMNHGDPAFLAKALRRCDVGVHDQSHNVKYKLGEEIPTADLEDELVRRRKKDRREGRVKDEEETQGSDQPRDGNEDSNASAEDESFEDDASIIDEGLDQDIGTEEQLRTKIHGDAVLEEYLESIDRKQSQVEEARLWDVLHGESYQSEDSNISIPPKPRQAWYANKSAAAALSQSAAFAMRWASQWAGFEESLPEALFSQYRRRRILKGQIGHQNIAQQHARA